MCTPVVTPRLAEKALTGAAVHALSVRAATGGQQRDLDDYQLFRDGTDPSELVESLTAYALALTWWYSVDNAQRIELLERATELMLDNVTKHPADAPELVSYQLYAHQVTLVSGRTADADDLNLARFGQGDPDVACRRAVYADAFVRSLLVAGHDVFGDPHTSAENLRNLMTSLAYAPVSA